MKAARSLPLRAALVAATAAAALLVSAFGGYHTTGATATLGATASAEVETHADKHNQADVTFAQTMILHHRQAIAMAEMARTRASSSDVKALAVKIKKEQAPEIRTMAGWLNAWGEKVPRGRYAMRHGHPSGMAGMMNKKEMHALNRASGKSFDTMFLTMMIKHHEGAVQMAKAEKKHGSYGPAKALANRIVITQTAEIAQMRKMLRTS
ncbi:DUF305 domain-containing protein [Streptomyces violaceusniger]|uniref:DUF305 domain-containing protein n=1 Tax=Streptomyces violaceusniger (strain Tu 4113) TaxID=653045 RepID=G2PCG3_STRV4|nr:DUF305 domain-containing protein [Streptomyces violaceusniger]AEM81991.1 protein of unknown function DUF305 [Streptomyces violaceusniger Tu 4113]